MREKGRREKERGERGRGRSREGVGDSWLEKRVARNGGKMCN